MVFSRRKFLSWAGASTLVTGLGTPLISCSSAQGRGFVALGFPKSPGYGALSPQLPQNAAELTATVAGDLSTRPLLALPSGFQYRVLSITGQPMDDGGRVPSHPDGMGVFWANPQDPQSPMIIVRNHELRPGEGRFGVTEGVVVPPDDRYSLGATGGTVTLVIDRQRQVLRQFASLGGTLRNCSGGMTPWGSWITCEEGVGVTQDNRQSWFHGYNFEVWPHDRPQTQKSVPLVAMGRFLHEAIAVHPPTGHVYQTEDDLDSCFYRFVPQVPGQLAQGGRLYALRLRDYPQGVNTSNNPNLGGKPGQIPVGQALGVDWVEIANPNPLPEVNPQDTWVRHQAQALGAAVFFRGEGIGYDRGLMFFTATQGGPPALEGPRGNGQVWAYDPVAETLTLWVEAEPTGSLLDEPDNLTATPFGDLLICEDGGGTQFVVGVSPQGELYHLLQNVLDNSEFAGICFAPDGETLVVNSQGVGITYAIWGPWDA